MWRFLTAALFALGAAVEHALFAVDLAQVSTCPESTSWALNFGAFIPQPPGAAGVQLRQIAFGRTPDDAGTLQPIFVSDGASSVSVPVMAVQPCCVATGCDLGNYVSVNGTWPSCGAPTGCGTQTVQWYMASFANSDFGTCAGCGIAGDADLDITFNGAALPLANYGSGTSFYVSYEPLTPTSPSSSATETPSMTPSGSVSPSVTKSMTPSPSMGVCAQVQQRFWGIRETVVGDVTYYITHGYNVTHPYSSPPEILVGHTPSCSMTGGLCRCVFQVGSTAVGCAGGRYVTIDYRIGGTSSYTAFNRQSPGCTYYFDAHVGSVSPSTTPTPTVSSTPTVSGSATCSPTASQSPSVSVSSSGSSSPSVSSSISMSISASTTQTRSRSMTRTRTPSVSLSSTGTPEFLISRWPSASVTGTGTASRSPAFIMTPWPSPGFSASATGSPMFMLVPIPSASTSEIPVDPAATAETEKINTATAIGGAAVGIMGGAAVIAGIAQLMSNLRPPQQQQQRENRDREKEPSEEELRTRAPEPQSPDDVEKLRERVRFDSEPVAPSLSADSALFAFRSEDVADIRRILAEHGAVYEIIRGPQ